MSKKKIGIVTSDKMDKTVVVKVTNKKEHPLYKKKYDISKKFHAHDEKNEYKIDDLVEIEETKPISKNKNWKVLRKKN